MADPYHDRPEWSYSSMKKILDSGIDYAVGARMGMTPKPDSAAIDLGQLVHQTILGGGDQFVIMKYPDLRSRDAQQWVKDQKAEGKIVISLETYDEAQKIIKNIKDHPHSQTYLFGKGIKHEQEMFGETEEGVKLRGKADAIKLVQDEALIICDIKTTAFFDKFASQAYWQHYDLQAANYTLIGAHTMNVEPELINYYFCVAETVAPYRVQYFHASIEFVESGERKLWQCVQTIKAFGDNQPNFLMPEIKELGDWSQ